MKLTHIFTTMKKALRPITIILISAFLLPGCTKQGSPGSQGPAGNNGNANVTSVTNLTTSGINWQPAGSTYYCSFFVPQLTQAIADKGAVMVYEQTGTGWNALPFTSGITRHHFAFNYENIQITWENSDFSQVPNPGIQTYRAVLIPSSIVKQYPTLNLRKYEDLKRILGGAL
jgi:hypothetical protein